MRSVFSLVLELLRSWEFIAVAVFAIVAFPLIFYIASFKPQRNDGIIQEKPQKKKMQPRVDAGDDDTGVVDPEA